MPLQGPTPSKRRRAGSPAQTLNREEENLQGGGSKSIESSMEQPNQQQSHGGEGLPGTCAAHLQSGLLPCKLGSHAMS